MCTLFFGLTSFSLCNYFEIRSCSCVPQWFLSSCFWVIFPYVNVPVCLPVRLLKDIWVISSFWPLQTNLPRTLQYMSLDTYLHFFFLGKYWGVKWLNDMTGVCVFVFQRLPCCLPKQLCDLTSHHQCTSVPLASYPHQWLARPPFYF